MAATVWILRRSASRQGPVVNGIRSAIINKDNTTVNEAQAIAAAVARIAAVTGVTVEADYFDSADQWNAAGQIDADGDVILFSGDRVEGIQ